MIDLRSDTVTKPSAAMREEMFIAEVGDDVYGEDPTVNRLEKLMADKLGKESAIFVSSGTQSNLLALLSHCERGDEYIVGQTGHTYKYEGGGAAVFGSIQPQPIEMEADGSLDLDRVKSMIKPNDFHFARTRLLCLENTCAGKVLPLSYLEQTREFSTKQKLSLHLDGARVFNASVKLKVDVRKITDHFDSVSVCLSKGLGAPVGSVLTGDEKLIKKARRWRKVLGGGMRQAGILAAAGIYALENNIERLAEDHQNAKILVEGLSVIDGLEILPESGQTNMVFMSLPENLTSELTTFLRNRDIRISPRNPLRLVTHLDITTADIDHCIKAIKEFFRQ